MTLVASLRRTLNYVINDDTAFPFQTAEVLNTSYATWVIGDPTKLTIVTQGWYWIGADITTLGTGYAGANNKDWLALIGRNGIDLAHTIIGERHYTEAPGGVGTAADAMTIGAPRFLYVADYVQLYLQNANGSSLLVEANPSGPPVSGSDYTAETGTGVISPRFYLLAMNGATP